MKLPKGYGDGYGDGDGGGYGYGYGDGEYMQATIILNKHQRTKNDN